MTQKNPMCEKMPICHGGCWSWMLGCKHSEVAGDRKWGGEDIPPPVRILADPGRSLNGLEIQIPDDTEV
ncbi:hypothetical protein [Lyngbya sp. CCY1209]|uniref:hypothetical protein n=1 Tax=Lyngbya sp. CCY1209 TaxID=2886103 RepID=UPI002D21052F|nr:hypothetical protein [Lyngbya sp. CCY1209]MEB3886926.1 hypothetical protein [Lyngbya sp. CCY1209]